MAHETFVRSPVVAFFTLPPAEAGGPKGKGERPEEWRLALHLASNTAQQHDVDGSNSRCALEDEEFCFTTFYLGPKVGQLEPTSDVVLFEACSSAARPIQRDMFSTEPRNLHRPQVLVWFCPFLFKVLCAELVGSSLSLSLSLYLYIYRHTDIYVYVDICMYIYTSLYTYVYTCT